MFRRNGWRVPRLALFIAATSVIVCLWALRQARAAVDEAMLGLGTSLMEYPGAKKERVRQLHLNGAQIYFRTQTVDSPSDFVIAHYEALCNSRGILRNDSLFDLPDAHRGTVDRKPTLRSIATTTVTDEGKGYVACLDMGAGATSIDTLASRFVRFARTGGLQELGQVRYAYAQSLHGSAGGRTFLLTMWTEGDFNVYDILPLEERDAAGHDLAQIPRPPDSQRILSSSEVGGSNAVVVYVAKSTSRHALERFYRDAFRVRNWEILERHPGERFRVNETSLVSAWRGAESITVLAYPVVHGRTGITVLMTGAP